MAWDFETEPEFQAKLDWADAFVREEVEPLDMLWGGLEFTPPDPTLKKILDPLKAEVRKQGLWATHLGPELGEVRLHRHAQPRAALLQRAGRRRELAVRVVDDRVEAPCVGERLRSRSRPPQRARDERAGIQLRDEARRLLDAERREVGIDADRLGRLRVADQPEPRRRHGQKMSVAIG